jgi:1,4-alpha-glucan branching enzyme
MKKKKSRGSKIAVTFEMPADVQCDGLFVAGDFNDWNTSATPLKRQKDGTWAATVSLAPGAYRYRYVDNGNSWHNDPGADRYEPSGFGEDNSVVEVAALT